MSYTKQQEDENTDYKAGHAISLEDRMISVKYDSTLSFRISPGSRNWKRIKINELLIFHIKNKKYIFIIINSLRERSQTHIPFNFE